MGAWGYAKKKGMSDAQAAAFVGGIFKNVPVLDTGGRGRDDDVPAARHRRRAGHVRERGRAGRPRVRRRQGRRGLSVDQRAGREPGRGGRPRGAEEGHHRRRQRVSRLPVLGRGPGRSPRITTCAFARRRSPTPMRRRSSRSSSLPSTRCSAAGKRRRRGTSTTAANSTASTRGSSGDADRGSIVRALVRRVLSRRGSSERMGSRPSPGLQVRVSFALRRPSVLPGFPLALGTTLLYIALIVLIPLSAAFLRTSTLTWAQFVDIVSAPRVLASLRLSFGAALIAALVNAVFGLLVAWVLVRYRFPGARIVDALVDLPFALPTAVAGIALDRALRPERDGSGNSVRSPGDQGGLHARSAMHDRAGVHRPAVRCSHQSNRCSSRPGASDARGGRRARSAPTASRPSINVILPDDLPRAADRLCVILRARRSANMAR